MYDICNFISVLTSSISNGSQPLWIKWTQNKWNWISIEGLICAWPAYNTLLPLIINSPQVANERVLFNHSYSPHRWSQTQVAFPRTCFSHCLRVTSIPPPACHTPKGTCHGSIIYAVLVCFVDSYTYVMDRNIYQREGAYLSVVCTVLDQVNIFW